MAKRTIFSSVVLLLLVIFARAFDLDGPNRQVSICASVSKKLDNYVIDSDKSSLREDIDQIVGGVQAKAGAYPYQAAILSGGHQFCGGSLIDQTHVLTAAHCVDALSSSDLPNLKVYLNTVSLKPDDGAVVRGIKRIVFPDSYDSETHENDIALITLSSPVTNVTPIKLPPAGSTALFTNANVTIIGWGTTSYLGKQSSVLMEATVRVISNTRCSSMYGMTMPASFLCAGAPDKDSCQGDSGGPMIFRGTQIGVVSWGYGCANPDYPGVYTRVTSFLSWINETRSAC